MKTMPVEMLERISTLTKVLNSDISKVEVLIQDVNQYTVKHKIKADSLDENSKQIISEFEEVIDKFREL